MSTKSRAIAPKGSKKGPKAETFYAQTLHAYFLSAFHGVHPAITKPLLPDETELIPVGIFLEGSAESKSFYYDPTPRTIKPIIRFIAAVHDRAIASIKADSPAFIRILETIAEPRNASLRGAIDPKGMINGTFSVAASRGTKSVEVNRAVAAMERFVKAIAEAMLSCVLVSKHLPGSKSYIPALCQAANLPVEIIEMAIALPPLPTKTKAIAVPAPVETSSADKQEDDDVLSETEEDD